jgi:hypothetical protein
MYKSAAQQSIPRTNLRWKKPLFRDFHTRTLTTKKHPKDARRNKNSLVVRIEWHG